MFGILDHLTGAALVRIKRNLNKLNNKPDVSFLYDNLAIGGQCKIRLLAENGFCSILDLREEDEDDKTQLNHYKINYLRIPIKDRNTPTTSQTELAINWIKQNTSNHEKIFIHCNLGRGRAPLLACLYLISNGLDPVESIKKIKKKRPYTYFNKIQLKFIIEFQPI